MSFGYMDLESGTHQIYPNPIAKFSVLETQLKSGKFQGKIQQFNLQETPKRYEEIVVVSLVCLLNRFSNQD